MSQPGRVNRSAVAVLLLSFPSACSDGEDRTRQPSSVEAPTQAPTDALSASSALPLRFERNLGQTSSEVEYLARGPGYTSFISAKELVTTVQGEGERGVIRMQLMHSNPKPELEGLEPLSSVSHYYLGNDAEKWRTEVPHFAQVKSTDVYPGVDVVFRGRADALEYDFVVAPNADPSQIEIAFSGADSVSVSDEGNLMLAAAGVTLVHQSPTVYQTVDGERRLLAGHYVLSGKDRVRFEVSDYDRTQPLIIDPVALVYSTRFGGSAAAPMSSYFADEEARHIAVGPTGEVFLLGVTPSLDFPTTSNAFQSSCNPNYVCRDLFVLKLDATGTQLVYSTYLGGSGYEDGNAIVASGGGAAMVFGSPSSDDFPLVNPDYDADDFMGVRSYAKSFITVFDANGTVSKSTLYCAGIGSVSADGFGGIVVAGNSGPVDDPTTEDIIEGCFEPSDGSRPDTTGGFAGTLDAGGSVTSAVRTAEYLQGQVTIGADGSIYIFGSNRLTKLDAGDYSVAYQVQIPLQSSRVFGIAADAAGSVYLTGSTTWAGFPVTQGAFQTTYHGDFRENTTVSSTGNVGDAFVMKISSDGAGIVWSTYLGGDGSDRALAISVDASGSPWITGWTGTPGPTGSPPVRFPLAGHWNGPFATGLFRNLFIARLDPAGRELVFSRQMGAYHFESGNTIAIDAAGSAYIGGFERSHEWPTWGGAPVLPTNEQRYGDSRPNAVLLKVHDDLVFRQAPPDTPEIELKPTNAEAEEAGSDADPVSTFSGELYLEEAPDLRLGGPMNLELRRYYASGLGSVGPLGRNWRHNFEMSLTQDISTLEILDWRGRPIRFWRNRSAWLLTGAVDVPYTLVETSNGFVLDDPRDERTYTFDMAGTLTAIEDGRGNTHALAYAGGRLTQVSDGLGRILSFNYSGSDLSSATDGTRIVTFVHAGGNLTGVRDAANALTSYSYDGSAVVPGLMQSKTLPDGQVVFTNLFDEEGRVIQQTDAMGSISSFQYDGAATTITDARGNSSVHVHSVRGQLESITDARNRVTQISYAASGARLRTANRLGRTYLRSRHARSGKTSVVTQRDGSQYSHRYDERTSGSGKRYDLSETTYPDGTSSMSAYDGNGNVTSITDEAGHTWSYTYDARGQMLTATNPLGGVTTYALNADGTVASVMDDGSNVTAYGYDALRRKTSQTFADGSSRSIAYDQRDRVISAVDELGGTTALTYNANGDLLTVTHPGGGVIAYAYDDMQRLSSIAGPTGATSAMSYDGNGELERKVDPDGNVTTFARNELGSITSITDANGGVWQQSYDDEQRLVSTTDPNGNVMTYVHDAVGRVTEVISPMSNTTFFSYDAYGHIRSMQDPLGHSTSYQYGPRGLLQRKTLPGGASSSYLRNGLGQITAATDPEGNAWLWSFDTQGRPLSSSDPLGNTTSYTHSVRSRLETVTYPGGGTQTLSYDAAGNITRRLYSDGTDLTFDYDADQSRTSATGIALSYDLAGDLSASNGVVIGRDPATRMNRITLAPGDINYTYDNRNLLTQVTDWVGGTTTFAYDAAGRLLTITRPNGLVTTNTYDAENRLTSITETDSGSTVVSALSFTRDARGFVSSDTRNVPIAPSATALPPSAAAYDAAAQVAGFSYDPKGRLIDDGVRTYVWDLADRLSSYTQTGVTVSYTYDAFGLVLSQTVGANERHLTWNYATTLPSVSVVSDGANDLRYYVYTPEGDLLYGINANNSRVYYHFDETGNTLFLTDDAGNVTDAYAYSPYGALTGSSGTTENPFTYAGRIGAMTEGAGLYRMRRRVYDSASRRFISRDPVPNQMDTELMNPYTYANANPLRYVDPSGEFPGLISDPKYEDARELASKLGGKARDVILKYPGRKAKKLLDQAEEIKRINRINYAMGKKGANGIKLMGLLRSSEKFSSIDRGIGYFGLANKTIGKTTKAVDLATKVLSSPDRREAINEIAKDYVTGKAVDKGKDVLKNAVGDKAFNVIEIGYDLYETNERVEKITADTKLLNDANLDGLYGQLDGVLAALKRGDISPEQAERMVRDFSAAFDESVTGNRDAGLANIAIESLRGLSSALAKAIGW